MKKRMDMLLETNYYMPYSYMLDSCQEHQISHQREVTWEQGPNQGSRIDYITEKPYIHHQLGVPRALIFGLIAAISWHWLRLACPG